MYFLAFTKVRFVRRKRAEGSRPSSKVGKPGVDVSNSTLSEGQKLSKKENLDAS